MKPELTGRALFRAVQQHRPAAGIIHDSDHGSQYCAEEHQAILSSSVSGFRCPAKAIALPARRWEASGEVSRPSWFTIGTSQLVRRQRVPFANTSRCSTTGKGGIPASDMTCLLCSRITSDRLKFSKRQCPLAPGPLSLTPPLRVPFL